MHYVAQLPNSGPLEALLPLLFFLWAMKEFYLTIINFGWAKSNESKEEGAAKRGPSSGGGWGPVGTSSS